MLSGLRIPGTNYAVFGASGVENSTFIPGSHYSQGGMFVDNDNLFLFGGMGCKSNLCGYISDLWRFNLTTRRWAWIQSGLSTPRYGFNLVEGANSKPGGVTKFAHVFDSDSRMFYVYGGQTNEEIPVSRMWKLNLATK